MRSFKSLLYKFFNDPSVVVIVGTWKTGKTDWGLRISEQLLAFNIVSRVASNIDTFGHYPQISDLVSLKNWLYENPFKKLFILDEANEHLPNTRSMSGKSVGFKQIIPQISKAHGRLLIIGHDLRKVDKELYNETWCRAVFQKPNTSFKYYPALIKSKLLKNPIKVTEIFPTKIKFDPYILAPFTEKPEGKTYFKDEDKQMLWLWANNDPQVKGKVPRMTIHRKLQKFILQTLESEM